MIRRRAIPLTWWLCILQFAVPILVTIVLLVSLDWGISSFITLLLRPFPRYANLHPREFQERKLKIYWPFMCVTLILTTVLFWFLWYVPTSISYKIPFSLALLQIRALMFSGSSDSRSSLLARHDRVARSKQQLLLELFPNSSWLQIQRVTGGHTARYPVRGETKGSVEAEMMSQLIRSHMEETVDRRKALRLDLSKHQAFPRLSSARIT